MKKILFGFILVGAIALIAVKRLQSPRPPAQNSPAAATTTVVTTTDNLGPALQPSTPAANPAPAIPTPAAAPAPVTPAAASITKTPKTITELYRAFDAINAAAEATTPESLATLIDFAATENTDVRTTALNAIINRDDASAAPLLRKAAKQLDDSKAIIALLQTADYIELPSTTMTALAALPKTSKATKPGDHTPAAETVTPSPTASP